MTFEIRINSRYTLVFSDTAFKPYRKKPTLSIYDAEENCEIKLASFNNQELFTKLCEIFENGK